jgi:hypothetical protein
VPFRGSRPRLYAAAPCGARIFMFDRNSRGVAPGYFRTPFQGSGRVIPVPQRGGLQQPGATPRVPHAGPSVPPFRAPKGCSAVAWITPHALRRRPVRVPGALPRAISGRPFRAHDFMFDRNSRGVAPGYFRAPFQGSGRVIPEPQRGCLQQPGATPRVPHAGPSVPPFRALKGCSAVRGAHAPGFTLPPRGA